MPDGNYLLQLLYNVSTFVILLPFLIGCIRLKFLDNYSTPLFVLICVSVIMEIVNEIFMKLVINNFLVFHLFTIVEFTLISLFYARFFKTYFKPLLFNLLIPVFLVIALVDYQINGSNTIDSFSISIESILLTGYALFLFYYILKHLLYENLLKTPVFWMNTAVLIYFSGNLFLFSFSNYMLDVNPSEHYLLWGLIHSFFNITLNVFLSIGFWKTKHK